MHNIFPIQVANCIRLSWIGLAVVLFGLLCIGALFVWIAIEGKEETPVTEQFVSIFATTDKGASEIS